MIINKINVEQKLFELLIPVLDEYKIKDLKAAKEICEKVVNNKSTAMNIIATTDIIKNEKFDLMMQVCNELRIEFMKMEELKNMMLVTFDQFCSNFPKIIVSLSYTCAKVGYTFIVDIDEHNEEFINICRKDTDIIEYKFTGTAFRSFVSEIVKSLNNVVYHTPNAAATISVDTFTGNKTSSKISVLLDLEDMITILNMYTVAVNTKFSKVLNNSFNFKIDSLDNCIETTDIKPVASPYTSYTTTRYTSSMAPDVDDFNDYIEFTRLADIIGDGKVDKIDGDSH